MRRQSTHETRYHEAAEAFGPALQRLARAVEANPDRQRDVLQDIHVALWRSLARFDGRCSLSTWVYRVAHNAAASYVDRERRKIPNPVTLDALDSLPDPQNFTRLAEESDAIDRLNAWIRRLKPVDRQIMTLYLEDLSAADMAEISGLTPGAIATRISRLKAQLAHDFEEPTHV